ncbi:MAG TPA: PLP-dependent transferase, partial [Rhizomicrobium sp.]
MTDKPDTIAVAAGRMSEEHFGVVNTPVYRASTILYPDLAALKALAGPYTYGRRGTPTTSSFEDAVTQLEGGARTVTVPSGLNAIATAILSVCGAGDHILITDSCYGPTRALCEKTLKRFGISASYYDPLIGGDIAHLLQPNTKAVFCE